MHLHRTSVSLLLLAALLAGCDDLPVQTVEVSDAGGLPGDAGAGDGSTEGGFDLAACQACFEAPESPGPGCGTEYEACENTAPCPVTIECLTPCLGMTLPAFVACALPCSSQVGEAGAIGTPAYAAGMNFFECATGAACGSLCVAP